MYNIMLYRVHLAMTNKRILKTCIIINIIIEEE